MARTGDTDAAEEITEVDGIHEIAVHMTTSVRHFMKRLMKSDLKRYTWAVESFEKMLRDSSGLSRDGHIRWTNVTLKKQRYGGKRVWNWTQLMRPFGVDGL